MLNSLLLALSATLADTLPPPQAAPIVLQAAGAFPAPTVAPPASAPRALAGPGSKPVAIAPPRALPPAVAAARRPRRYSADSLVLDKSDRKLGLYQQGQLVAEYNVALGANPVGPKERRGDGRTPEGLYFINARNPESKYHLSLRISYPDSSQLRRAAQRGVSPGGDIMIHGLPRRFATVGALHRQQDWTEGCIAVTNDEIEEIWRAVPDGARILIRP